MITYTTKQQIEINSHIDDIIEHISTKVHYDSRFGPGLTLHGICYWDRILEYENKENYYYVQQMVNIYLKLSKRIKCIFPIDEKHIQHRIDFLKAIKFIL